MFSTFPTLGTFAFVVAVPTSRSSRFFQPSDGGRIIFPTLVCFPVGADGGRAIHLSYFILHPSLSTDSRNQASFVTGLQSYLIQPVAKIHFIALEPPSPLGKGDVTAQKELFRPRVKGITVEASKSFHLPFILFHTGLHKSFSARVVFIPPSPPEGGCDYAAISMPRLRSFLRPADV